MKNLIIIGAGGLGREVFNFSHNCLGYGEKFRIKGFLDDKPDALDDKPGYAPILGPVKTYEIQSGDVFICAMGVVYWKKYCAQMILDKGGHFVNLIHKSAVVARNTTLGQGCVINRLATISCDCKVGNFVTIMDQAIVGHDCQIGDGCHLGVRCFLGGGVRLEEGATIQTSAVVLPYVKVGHDAIVGACSNVICNVKAGTSVLGVPAQRVKM